MPAISLPKELTPSAWANFDSALAKAKDKPNQKFDYKASLTRVGSLAGKIDWSLLNVDKVTTLEQADEQKKALQDHRKAVLLGLDAETGNVADAWDFVAKEGKKIKDFPKEVLNAAATFSKVGFAYRKEVESAFGAASDAIDAKAKQLKQSSGKAKPPAAGGGASKADEQLLMKLSKKAVAFAMKPKAGALPMMFAVLGKIPGKARVLMGTKTDVAKLIGKFGKADPTTKKKPPLAKDPKSQVLWENGGLVFVSAKIPTSLVSCIKKAMQPQLKKSPKVKMRKPGHPDVEAEGGGDEMKADELQEAETKADPREQMAAQGEFKSLLQKVNTAMTAALKTRSAEDRAEISDILKEANDAAQKGDYVEGVSLLEAVETMLDEAPDDAEDDSATPEPGRPPNVPRVQGFKAKLDALMPRILAASQDIKAKAANAARLGASESGVDQANEILKEIEKALASTGAAGQVSMENLRKASASWTSSRRDALAGINSLAETITKLFRDEKDQRDNLIQAIGKLGEVKKGLAEKLEGQLKAALAEQDPGKRTLLANEAKATVEKVKEFLRSDEVAKSLDDESVVKGLKVVAPLTASLEEIKTALG